MKIRLLANKWRHFVFLRKTCYGCGAESISAAKFCGHCGLRLRQKNILRSLKRKHLFAAAFLMFFVAFLLTLMVLRFQAPVYADNQVFDDVALDHPVYTECKNLLAFDGVLLRSRGKFSPYEKISVDEFNQALLAAIRFNRCPLQGEMLIEPNRLQAEFLREKVKKIADLTGKRRSFDRIEKAAFFDLSRFNQLAMLDRIFMRGNDEK